MTAEQLRMSIINEAFTGDWESVSLGEVCVHENGDRGKNYPSKDKLGHEGIPFISALNLANNTIIDDDKLLKASEVQFNNLRSGHLKKGDFVVCIRGSIGKHGIYPFEKGAIASSLVILRPDENKLSLMWLSYYFDSGLFQDSLSESQNGTAQPNLGAKELMKFELPLPPLAEQKRIVAKLEELLPIVEQYGKAQTELDELNAALPARLRQSILQEAISGRLVPQDPNDEPASVLLERLREERCNRIKLGEIKLSKPEKALRVEITNDFELPISWTWCVLNDVCRAFGRIGYRGYTKEDIVTVKEKGAIAISPSNMENNRLKLDVCTYISEAKYLESPEIMLENGDILLTKTASVGKLALVEDLPWKATINPQIAVLKEISIDRKYLTYALASPYIQDIIHGFTIGTSIPTYSQEKMIGINIPLPPLAEQKRIVAKIEELFAEIDKLVK